MADNQSFMNSNPALVAVVVDISSADYVLSFTARSLYIGGTGNVKVDTPVSSGVVFQSVPAGFILPVCVTKVYRTGTTATNIVAIG